MGQADKTDPVWVFWRLYRLVRERNKHQKIKPEQNSERQYVGRHIFLRM